jgi:hypothetical protein
MSTINTDQPVYMQIVERVGQYPQGVARSQIAADFAITYSTATEHLERAWSKGLIRKFEGWITNRSRGWLYASINQLPLPGWELIAGAEDDDDNDLVVNEGDPDFHNFEAWYNQTRADVAPDDEPDEYSAWLEGRPDRQAWSGS